MRILLLLTFFAIIDLNSYGQFNMVSGVVLNAKGKPLKGVCVCQDYMHNCLYTDYKGFFNLKLDPSLRNDITFSYSGFHSVVIQNVDSMAEPINIIMVGDTLYSHPEEIDVIGFTAFFQVDYIFNDFSEFEPLLNNYNVAMMNEAQGVFSFELAWDFKRYYAGFNWGFAFVENDKQDSLNIEFNRTQYGLHFGYNLINSNRFLITPKVAVKWNRYRLINSYIDRKFPFSNIFPTGIWIYDSIN